MADDNSPGKKPGCGLISAMFGCLKSQPKKSNTEAPIVNDHPAAAAAGGGGGEGEGGGGSIRNKNILFTKSPGMTNSMKRRILDPSLNNKPDATQHNHQSAVVSNESRKDQENNSSPTKGIGISAEPESSIVDPPQNGSGQKAGNNPPQNGNNEKAGVSLCRDLSTRMDPEKYISIGNEDYKDGKYPEALASYDAAIAIDPGKASYRCNRTLALSSLGWILDAAFECREAIKIEPHYHRAHHILANLYIKLGEAEKAIYHYKNSGPEGDEEDIAKAKGLQVLLDKCTEAKRLRDWNSLIQATEDAISTGADAAPHIYALQAEAFLRLHRHQEAEELMSRAPNFDVETCTKYFGTVGNANLLVVRAQVDMAKGRFDEALAASQRAAKLDPNNNQTNLLMKKIKAVVTARTKGNELFNADRYTEAVTAYAEGLDEDPYNSVLLCNLATCRVKLGQYDKAIESCTMALKLRSGYYKARLRRADCYAEVNKWAEAVEDYRLLQKEKPDDEEVARKLAESRIQLNNNDSSENRAP